MKKNGGSGTKDDFNQKLGGVGAFGITGVGYVDVNKIAKINNHFDGTSGVHVRRSEDCSYIENLQNA